MPNHINQKTQFENPVMEAKKQHNQEAPAASQPGLTPSGNHQTSIFLPRASPAFVHAHVYLFIYCLPQLR
ncbi:membrane-associated guanylate kinase, WW and PDZ domain-containing protein 3a isoform X1 [Tachysurus ichikawai]